MTRQYLVLAVGVLAVSFAALFIKLADAPPLVIAAFRLCLASLALVPLSWRHLRTEMPRLDRRDVRFMLLAGLALAVHFGLWITSLRYTSVVTSVVLVTASPIILAIASRFLFAQRLSRLSVIGIIISLGGVFLIGFGNWRLGAQSFQGAVLALGGALAISVYLLIGQHTRRKIGTLSYISVVYGTAAVFLLAAVFVAGYSFVGYSGRTYIMMVLLAVVPQLIGHSSINWALRFIPATLVAVAVLGEPVGASLWAVVFLHESLTVLEIIGSILILSGIYLTMRRR
jgi:drug/metabolite transporter (DMT)-like permease